MNLEYRKYARRFKQPFRQRDGEMFHPMIQWFIAEDNYGAYKYKGQFYNLMNNSDKNILTVRLILDGLITVQGRTIYDSYDGKESLTPGYFRVIHPDHLYIACAEERFFWCNIRNRIIDEMTQEECDIYNQDIPKEETHV